MHNAQQKGVTCPAIDGIIKEANETIGEVEDKEVLDARSSMQHRPLNIMKSPVMELSLHGLSDLVAMTVRPFFSRP